MTLILNDTTYNTKIEADRRFIGDYFEKKLLIYFINNGISVQYIAENNRFSLYDFIVDKDGIKYIVELKSRLKSVSEHIVEYICYNKITAFRNLIKKNMNTKVLFIFCHISDEKNYEFYHYCMNDFNILDDICFLTTIFDKKTYELPVKYLRPLEEFI
jgi:hypothetical protein